MLFIDMQMLIINTRKIMTKIENPHNLSIGIYVIFMDGQCDKSCLLVVFSGLKIHLNLIKIS